MQSDGDLPFGPLLIPFRSPLPLAPNTQTLADLLVERLTAATGSAQEAIRKAGRLGELTC